MAGDWIKMRLDLPRRPQVAAMASMIDTTKPTVIGGLFMAWSLFDSNTEDGILKFYSLDMLDAEIGIPGFGSAMCAVHWLNVGEGFIAMPGFDDHMGECSRRREKEATRKREYRERQKAEKANAEQHGDMSQGHTGDKSRMSPVKEEKIREEKKDLKHTGPVAAHPTATAEQDNPKTKKGTRLPDGFIVPPEWIQWAAQEGELTQTQIEREAAIFVDYWIAQPGQNGVKADWRATWRNWIRKAAERATTAPRKVAAAPTQSFAPQPKAFGAD